MTVDETIKQLIAQRDSAIYRLIDYRISKGEWKLEDREQHFAEMLAVCERAEHKPRGSCSVTIISLAARSLSRTWILRSWHET